LLTSDRIADFLEKKDEDDPFVVVPSPDPRLRNSGAVSFDVRLGCWFASIRKARKPVITVGSEHQEQLIKEQYIPFGQEYYLHPGCFTLAITLEWFRFPKKLSGVIGGKSSWGRRGLIVETAAVIHPGFTGCLTLELSNVGELPIELKPGLFIAQVCIYSSVPVETKDRVNIDKTTFFGQRKPTLGIIQPDAIANKLMTPTRACDIALV
jgi:dCTP deaminase